MKLTEAKKRALNWYAENDGSNIRPVGLAKLTLDRLVDDGLLKKVYPTTGFGMIRYFITEAGRSALRKEERG